VKSKNLIRQLGKNDMAHFAELNSNNVVLRVNVIGNQDTSDANGVEKEYIGQAFCERLWGGTWMQTSYNGNFRKKFAGIGDTYDAQRNAYISPKPYASWVLNEDTCKWQAPVAMPVDGGIYSWDETVTSWVAQA
jgi:hypothetical protein